MKGVRLAKNMVAIEKRQEIVSARSFKRTKRPLNFFFQFSCLGLTFKSNPLLVKLKKHFAY